MVRRIRTLVAVLALMAFVVTAVQAADENTHMGKVVSTGKNKLTMTGTDGKEHSHAVADDAKITCDGKVCKLEDLKKGITVKVTTKKDDPTTAVAIEGSTKDDK